MKITRRRILLWAGGGLLAGAAGWKLLRGFEDQAPEKVAEEIPPALRGAALDVHAHILGTGAGSTGCWMHPQMRRSIQVAAGLWSYGLSLDDAALDSSYVEFLRRSIRGAGFLKQVVALAMDYTCSPDGRRLEDRTPFYTPNDYVAALAARHPEFLFGASIHPYRPDALDELDRCAALGAVLVKWIPNVQAMDPADARCRAFYRKLAEHRIALLSHAGDEKALFVSSQDYGDPRRLVAALEEGVTVIAAHAASLGERDSRSNMDLLFEMFPRWPNLFADTSALTLITRWRKLRPVIERREFHARLLHGSDFPIPPACTMYLASMSPAAWWRAWTRANPLRRDFLIKQALGMPAQVYTRGYEVLAPRVEALPRHIGAGPAAGSVQLDSRPGIE
jgi:predicted TIM-barrel fold metal-dependent hydrolase